MAYCKLHSQFCQNLKLVPNLNLAPKMLYLGTLRQKYEKNIVTYESDVLKFVKMRIFVQKEYFEFGIKKAFLEYFRDPISKGIVIFEISTLALVKQQSFVQN